MLIRGERKAGRKKERKERKGRKRKERKKIGQSDSNRVT